MTLPAYGRDLLALQRSGRNVTWLVVSLGFDLGRAMPRVVVPNDMQLDTLDMSLVDGVSCLIAHEDQRSRALDVAEIVMRNGATHCTILDAETAESITTAEVMAIRGKNDNQQV